MSMLEWIAIGAITLTALFFCARIMRKGISSLDEDRERLKERLAEEEKKLARGEKDVSAQERLYVTKAAILDFLRLEAEKTGDSHEPELDIKGDTLEFMTPQGPFSARLVMRERLLATTRKVIHGRAKWILKGGAGDNAFEEEHGDIGSLMASVNSHWHGRKPEAREPEFLARRLARCRRERNKKH